MGLSLAYLTALIRDQSAIDLTLVTPDTVSGAERDVGADSLSSDHLPITVSFVFSAEKETPATTSKYNYDLANWDLFRSLLGSAVINVGDADLDEVNRRIVSSILEAARKLGEHVGRAIGRRKVLLTCFFDISRAYNQVRRAKLLQKLDKMGISGNMYN